MVSTTPAVDNIVCPGVDADKFLSYVRSLAFDMPRRFLFPSVLDVGSKAMRAVNTAIRKRGTRDISTPHMLPRGGATLNKYTRLSYDFVRPRGSKWNTNGLRVSVYLIKPPTASHDTDRFRCWIHSVAVSAPVTGASR